MVPSYQTVARLMYYRIQYSYYYYYSVVVFCAKDYFNVFFFFIRFYMEVVDSFLVMTVIPVKR